jgi:hypothetical protein
MADNIPQHLFLQRPSRPLTTSNLVINYSTEKDTDEPVERVRESKVETKKEGGRGPELWKGRSPSSDNLKEHRRRWSEDETEDHQIH